MNSNLFKAILKREPNDREKNLYGSYSDKDLINLLQTCEEKINYLKNLSGDRNNVNVNYTDHDIQDFFTNKHFKVAICLSGHLREYEQNLSSINKFLVKPLNADVFIHSWDTRGTQIQFTANVVGPKPDETEKVDESVITKFLDNVKKIKIENNSVYLEGLNEQIKDIPFYLYGSILNKNQGIFGGQAEPQFILSQLYSIKESFELIDNKDEYDIVIKLRADYTLMSGIEYKELELAYLDKHIAVPNIPYSNHGHPVCCLCEANIEHNNHIEDVCDLFAFGNSNTMSYYMSLYSKALEYNDIFNMLNNDFDLSRASLKKYKNYNLIDIWHLTDYKFNCFYPERLLRYHLTQYKLLGSKLTGQVKRKR